MVVGGLRSCALRRRVVASVVVESLFTRKPAGTTRGHYGYLFPRVIWSDGTTEEVLSDELSVVNLSPNVHVIPPGGTDNHTGDSNLYMYNTLLQEVSQASQRRRDPRRRAGADRWPFERA